MIFNEFILNQSDASIQVMRPLFIIQIPVSHHVGIIPVTGPSVGDDDVLVIPVVVDGSLHAVPRVLDVVEVPPEATGVDDGGVIWRHPGVGLVKHLPIMRVLETRAL